MITFTFLDLWIVPLFALALQIFTTLYFLKIYKRIGGYLTHIFVGFHILGYIYIFTVLYRWIGFGVLTPQYEPEDMFRIFFGLVFPVANNLLHLRLKRFYKQGLEPNKQQQEDDSARRDIKRDAQRDVQRDIDRDRERDMRRDLYRDKDTTNQ